MPREPFRVTHIFLDVDGTLVDFRAALWVGLVGAAEYLSEQSGRVITPAQLQEVRDRVARSFRGTWNEVRLQSFRQVLRERGIDDEATVLETNRRFHEARDAALAPFEDVVGPLTLLRERGFVLVAATNGNAALMRTPVFNLLHETWSADEAGVTKPHPAFFEGALAKVGVQAAHSLMVGDRMDNDVEPAASLGMPAVLLDRAGTIDGIPYPAASVIRSLRELPALVELSEE